MDAHACCGEGKELLTCMLDMRLVGPRGTDSWQGRGALPPCCFASFHLPTPFKLSEFLSTPTTFATCAASSGAKSAALLLTLSVERSTCSSPPPASPSLARAAARAGHNPCLSSMLGRRAPIRDAARGRKMWLPLEGRDSHEVSTSRWRRVASIHTRERPAIIRHGTRETYGGWGRRVGGRTQQ
jgi:hypothetical protein